jgi:predicted GNAT family acetyltransferase
MEIRYRDDRDRWELLDGEDVIGVADRVDRGEVVVLPHVEVDPDRRGHGLAAKLTAAALDDLRAEGKQVVAQCPYVAAYIRRHPEYHDLLA